MWIADAEGTVQRVNKSLCEFLRLEPEKIIDHYNVLRDKNLENQDLMPAVKSVFTALKPIRFMLKWKPDLAGEVDFKTAPTIFLKATMFPITNTQGELTNVLCQWIDITDLKEAEKKLIEYRDHLQEMVDEKTRELHTSNLQLTSKNKELQNFAYSVSHDLRAPLRSIIGFSEIVVNRYKDALPPEGKTYLNYILEAGNNMANLINDLLLYARLGKKETRQADLNKIFAEILRKLNKDIESEKAVIKLPENLPVIKSNPTLINQIFLNLIGNAINYHQPSVPPEITIKIKQEKEKLILSVKDNGIGIAEKFHDKIFSIFQRLHADDEYKGTGIGLAIAKKAVENLEGKIWLQSKMGEGTTFFVELPNQID